MSNIVIVGLGYVGLPIANAFAKHYATYGLDINIEKINKYKMGIDITKEIGDKKLKECKIKFSSDFNVIKECDYVIITVPTPIDEEYKPNLLYLENATKMVAEKIKSGTTIIYESTVYPGTTEKICIPLIEKISNKKLNQDFFVGYSPERINPGDTKHRFENINKLVSGSNNETTEKIADLYQRCLKADVIKVSSIKVAEASKIIENSQRDVNIAFINEMAKILHSLNVDTKEVLEAASTKWNFLNFRPGLVGGHCIGVDPYYLIYEAEKLNVSPNMLLTSRNINENMKQFIIENLKDILKKNGINLKDARILIKGITFKENIPDIRNSKVIDIIKELKRCGLEVYIEDYNVEQEELKNLYNMTLSSKIPKVDVIVFAVKHQKYCEMKIEDIDKLYRENANKKILFDLGYIFDKAFFEERGYEIWTL